MKFDVVISTLQSESVLEECLNAVLREVPVNRIIVVDGGSTDRTLEILSKYPQVEFYVQPQLSLGESRCFGFSQVETNWFVQLDSDVILRRGWLNALSQYMKNGIGVVEGQKVNHYTVKNKLNPKRALFGCCLVQTGLVKNIDMPFHHLEDEYVRRILEGRGYSWVKAPVWLADHYSNPVRYKNHPVSVTRIRSPAWCSLEHGKLDALTNRKLLAVLKYVFGKTVKNFLDLSSQFFHMEVKLLHHLKGYINERF